LSRFNGYARPHELLAWGIMRLFWFDEKQHIPVVNGVAAWLAFAVCWLPAKCCRQAVANCLPFSVLLT